MGARCTKLSLCWWPPHLKSSSNYSEFSEDEGKEGIPAFTEFGLDEFRPATDGFSADCIVSEHCEKAPNVIYRGFLFYSDRIITEKARAVGQLRSERLASLIE